MGVGRPKDFVTIRNRFPAHDQRVTIHSNECFVTIFSRNQLVSSRLLAEIPNFYVDTIGEQFILRIVRNGTMKS
jgi:hypothetical protein